MDARSPSAVVVSAKLRVVPAMARRPRGSCFRSLVLGQKMAEIGRKLGACGSCGFVG